MFLVSGNTTGLVEILSERSLTACECHSCLRSSQERSVSLLSPMHDDAKVALDDDRKPEVILSLVYIQLHQGATW